MLPSPLPPRVVMITAGSGITPAMAMLRGIAGSDTRSEVIFVHCARSPRELIFARELRAMARRQPWLRLQLHFTGTSGRLEADAFTRLAAEAGTAPTFACGPDGFTAEVRHAWRAAGYASSLRVEHFGLPVRRRGKGRAETIEAAPGGRKFRG